jgi:hypothetical protein
LIELVIPARTGKKKSGLRPAQEAVRFPSFLSYGQLKLLPFWDPLRGDPRFEKIVDSLAPQSN